jgi:hypothetical protein
MLKSILKQVHYVKNFVIIRWQELGCQLKNMTLCPFAELFDSAIEKKKTIPVNAHRKYC